MSQFEYLSIAASIVLALAMGRLISSIPYVFQAKKVDLIHSLLFLWMIFGCLLQWWNLWPLNSVSDWSLTGYLILMASPISYYLAAKIIVSDSPDDVQTWEQYFAENYRWFFVALFTAWLSSRVRQYYFFDEIPSIFGLLFGAAALAGALISSFRKIVHLSVAIYIILFTALGIILVGS